MKKVFTFFAAMSLLASVAFAQTAHRMRPGEKAAMAPIATFKAQLKKATVTPAKDGDVTISTFPWEEGFESASPNGFVFVDADNDGFNWMRATTANNFSAHSGDGVIISASYDNDTESPLTPDDWMILPAFQIPSDASDFILTWWEKGQDVNYAAEFYSVYINTTGNTVANFTATSAVYSGTSTGEWVKKTVNLGSYAGQTIYIAFRHHNISDMFYLNIDDIRVGGPLAPEVSLDGPAIAILNQTVTYTATASTPTVTWYVDGTQESETGLTLSTMFTTAGAHQVVVEATNTVGSTYDTLDVTVVDCGTGITTFPYYESFDALNPCWQFVSADPANDNRVGINSEVFYEGTGSFTLSSYSTATDYNQFLISPEITLPTGTDYYLGFWYKGYNAADAFRVKLSTTTADTAAFTTVLADYPEVNTDWTFVALQIPANTKHIAINYYGEYQYYLYIDALTIDEMGAPMISLIGDESVGTGMDAYYYANVSLEDSVIWYVDGNVVSSIGNILTYTFTTAGLHEVVAEAVNSYGSSFDTLSVDVFSCDGTTIPYTPDFTAGLGCWSSRSDETEGSGWFASVDMFESNPEGQILSMSAQSIWGIFMQDFPVDNWIFSPVVAMPESGNYEIAWQVKPFTPDYAGDHYGVYIITGSDTTLLFEETLSSDMTDYVERTAIIPASVTGDFRFAFRHWNCEGGYVIILDQIQLRNLTAPSVVLNGPTAVITGDQVTYTAVSGTATSFSWTVDGVDANESTNTLTTSFATAGTHTVSVTVSNAAGSNSASLTVNAIACDAITSFPWICDFESATGYDCWKFIDADGDGYNWDTDFLRDFVDSETGMPNPQGHNSSNGLAGSASWNQSALTPDNWMILPAMALPADAQLYLSWYEKGQDPEYAEEHYSVYISTTGNNVNDFTTASGNFVATGEWVGHNINLGQYAGQTIYIAFRHHDCTDMFYLDIDDIMISTDAVVGIDNVENSILSLYPNPASAMVTVSAEGIEGNVTVQVVDLNGRVMMQQQGNAQSFRFDVSTLAQGAYFVRLTGENVNAVRKLIVK